MWLLKTGQQKGVSSGITGLGLRGEKRSRSARQHEECLTLRPKAVTRRLICTQFPPSGVYNVDSALESLSVNAPQIPRKTGSEPVRFHLACWSYQHHLVASVLSFFFGFSSIQLVHTLQTARNRPLSSNRGFIMRSSFPITASDAALRPDTIVRGYYVIKRVFSAWATLAMCLHRHTAGTVKHFAFRPRHCCDNDAACLWRYSVCDSCQRDAAEKGKRDGQGERAGLCSPQTHTGHVLRDQSKVAPRMGSHRPEVR